MTHLWVQSSNRVLSKVISVLDYLFVPVVVLNIVKCRS
jgi:hypothetical protein